jgi:2-succinyl-6-hydroxy-2,4-cyclohexadiene-1-carboxylate synthase
MIHFFPGLFCDESMWKPYLNLDHHHCHDLNDVESSLMQIKPNDTLVGYSMGGRIALGLARRLNYKINKIILLSSHPGLNVSEIPLRRKWEDEIIEKMRNLDKDKFFEFWDSLPLFSQSRTKKEISEEVFKENGKLFIKHRLSEQDNYFNDLILNRKKILYVYGNRDEKYTQIGIELRTAGIKAIGLNADHRVHLAHKQLLSLLRKEISA